MIRANNDDEAVGWTEAQWIISNGKGKTARPLRYETPIQSCSLCGTPCGGVMCLSCATQ